jgi:hypothetical protein
MISPPAVHCGDLLEDLPGLAAQAPPRATLVVYHSAVLAYVDERNGGSSLLPYASSARSGYPTNTPACSLTSRSRPVTTGPSSWSGTARGRWPAPTRTAPGCPVLRDSRS